MIRLLGPYNSKVSSSTHVFRGGGGVGLGFLLLYFKRPYVKLSSLSESMHFLQKPEMETIKYIYSRKSLRAYL